MSGQDSVLRAMTNDGAFRVIVANTTETVLGAIAAQDAEGPTARQLADLVTGSILLRETMAPTLRVQAVLQGAGAAGRLIADSHPDGWARALVQLSRGGPSDRFGSGAVLQMMRSLPNGELHRGVVEVPAKGGLSAALMGYMQHSEQVVSVVDVGCAVEASRIVVAGGYLVQLLPEVEQASLAIMTERMNDFASIERLLVESSGSPARMMDEILYGMPYTELGQSVLRFDCNCSAVRVLTSLATLPRKDVEDLLESSEELRMHCDYCGKEYLVSPEQLRGLLEAS